MGEHRGQTDEYISESASPVTSAMTTNPRVLLPLLS